MTLKRWLSRLVGCSTLTLAAPLGAQGLDPPPGAAVDAPPGAASDAPPPAPTTAPPAANPAAPDWSEPPDEELEPADGTGVEDSAPEQARSPEERERSLS